MTKLCPRGKAAAKRKLKFILVRTLMLMHQKYVQVKLKIQAVKKEKILGDQNQKPWAALLTLMMFPNKEKKFLQ